MKSKEALENVKTAPSFMGGNPRYWTCLESRLPFLDDINIIEQDLDKLEKLEKAIEIMKNTNVNIFEFLESKNVVDYNNLTWSRYDFDSDELTEEQYNLLKEVLGNE